MKLNDINLFVISGPSGSGKGTLINRYLKENSDIEIAISATTRAPRKGEVHGKDYYFISEKEFNDHISNGDFIEFCDVHKHKYGTLKQELERISNQKKIIFLEIDTIGAQKLKNILTSATFIFITAPDLKELENRLILRKTESHEQIKIRLETANNELKRIELYDYVIINDMINTAYFDFSNIIKKSFFSRG